MTPAGWGLYQWRVEALSVSLYAQRHFCRFHSFTCCRSKSELEEDVVVGECINWKEGGPGWQQMKPAIYRNGGLQWRCVSRSSCLLFKSDFLDSGALFYLRLASAVNLLPTSTQTVSIWAGWKVWALEKKRQNDVIEAVEDKLAMNDSHAFYLVGFHFFDVWFHQLVHTQESVERLFLYGWWWRIDEHKVSWLCQSRFVGYEKDVCDG